MQVPGDMGDVDLGRGVDGEGREDVPRRDRGGVDQVGHPALTRGRDQLRGERADDVHQAGDVEVDLVLPPGSGRPYRRRVGHVDRKGQSLAAVLR
jgi:hypothetical protein